MIPFSFLDLCPIVEGGSAAQSFANMVDLAQHAEGWGFKRYWMAEHHGMPGIGSAATAVLIGRVAVTQTPCRGGMREDAVHRRPTKRVAEVSTDEAPLT